MIFTKWANFMDTLIKAKFLVNSKKFPYTSAKKKTNDQKIYNH